MIPWEQLGRAPVAGGELVLARRGDEYSIRLRGNELMNSRMHFSEEQLAALGCAGLRATRNARVLVGGLGMGFTARAALDVLAPDAHVTIAELVPEVVAWNRGPLAHLARAPLDDKRVELRTCDVLAAYGERPHWHAILLDVDNAPEAFTAPANARLYGRTGLTRVRAALVPGGAFAVWSVASNRKFEERMTEAGFNVAFHRVPPRPGARAQHVIWVARVQAGRDRPAPAKKPRRS